MRTTLGVFSLRFQSFFHINITIVDVRALVVTWVWTVIELEDDMNE